MAYDVKNIANKLLVMSELKGELMSNMKLQKMLYYQQGYHLAYFGTPLFDDEIEAWMYGPVVPCVYEMFSSKKMEGIIGEEDKDFAFSDKKEECLFNEVFRVYGKYSAIGLMEMTHSETPWKTTPVGRGHVIGKEKIKAFFKKRLK